MSPVASAVICLIAALAAFAASLALVRFGHRHSRALDDTWSGPQKIHETPVPRVGGLAIALGMLAAAIAVSFVRHDATYLWLLLACVTPGFAWGFLEDLSKKVAVFGRLAITA